jgi:hypothetical protein
MSCDLKIGRQLCQKTTANLSAINEYHWRSKISVAEVVEGQIVGLRQLR